MSARSLLLLALALPASQLGALVPEEGALFVRILDVGAGHAAVAIAPGGGVLVYDAGGGTDTLDKVLELVPAGAEIDLLVLSHSDADHIGAADEILAEYTVSRVLRTGHERSTYAWRDADRAVRDEVETEGALDLNLARHPIPPGATWRVGDAFATMVSGHSRPPSEWGPLSESERRNAVSVVVRLLFAGRAVLFTGDAVGRHNGDPPWTCIATEDGMVRNSPAVPVASDVLIAPHHGADNGSSELFIRAVAPDWVVFPAGHRHDHPRASAAGRYLDWGLPPERLLRTDLGDDEGAAEWDHGREPDARDPKGDDDVDILVRADGTILVAYRADGPQAPPAETTAGQPEG